VPPCAAWNSPGLSSTAPVKLPLRWPKNSLSISSDGIAPQLTGTNGLRRASLFVDQPCDQFFAAARLSADVDRRLTARQLVDLFAQIAHGQRVAEQRRSIDVPAPPTAGMRNAVLTSSRKRVRSTGLVRKSKAPAFNALIAVSRLP
jgi:hypothetical protein